MSNLRRITGGPISLLSLATSIPARYTIVQDGTDFAPGRIGIGPFSGNEVTVCLLDGDDGAWFKSKIDKFGGSWELFPKKPGDK